jgi:hypothetical protein
MPLGTFIGTGLLEPMRCMSYFPVIIKTRHFKSMRAYFETYHKRPFDDIFLNVFNNGSYSQFNIMVCLPNSVLLLTFYYSPHRMCWAVRIFILYASG